MTTISEVDYIARPSQGGSKSGKDMRHPGRTIKFRVWELALELIAHGNESYFVHAPFHSGRWSLKNFRPIVAILWQEMPELCQAYFGGREEVAANLIMQRHHKMYYIWKNGRRTRCISTEHPSRWPVNWRELEPDKSDIAKIRLIQV